jgi:hypothetical protein
MRQSPRELIEYLKKRFWLALDKHEEPFGIFKQTESAARLS